MALCGSSDIHDQHPFPPVLERDDKVVVNLVIFLVAIVMLHRVELQGDGVVEGVVGDRPLGRFGRMSPVRGGNAGGQAERPQPFFKNRLVRGIPAVFLEPKINMVFHDCSGIASRP